MPAANHILTINGGSSSIKFALFESVAPLKRIATGQIERIGTPGAQIVTKSETHPVKADSMKSAAREILDYLHKQHGDFALAGIGHRIVTGGTKLFDHQPITAEVLAELQNIRQLDLPHLPREIELIEAFSNFNVRQIACFDTAFHKDLPDVAKLLPIPRKYIDAGVRRLGFHGLSYTYLMSRLREISPEAANGRIILAHLGSGASMAAVRNGKPIDTSMSFTPTAGLVMGTRPGDIDPGLLIYLMRDQNLSLDDLDKFISQKCGLLGISETTSDMRDLVQRKSTDPRAADAFNLFCYEAKKFIGAYTAALGGLDTLIFSGGIGEHSPEARAGICDGLECLGISIDPNLNSAAKDIISTPQSRVTVRIIPTDEEMVIAQIVSKFLVKS